MKIFNNLLLIACLACFQLSWQSNSSVVQVKKSDERTGNTPAVSSTDNLEMKQKDHCKDSSTLNENVSQKQIESSKQTTTSSDHLSPTFDGNGVDPENQISELKHLLEKATLGDSIDNTNYKRNETHQELLKDDHVSSVSSESHHTISSGRKIPASHSKLSNICPTHFKRKEISQNIVSIPSKNFSQQDIYHLKIADILSNPDLAVSKIGQCGIVTIRGNLNIESFVQSYFGLQKLILVKTIDYLSERKTQLNLFATPENEIQHQKLFEEVTVVPDWEHAMINLTDPKDILKFNEICLQNKPIQLHVFVLNDNNLERLSEVIYNDLIFKIHLSCRHDFTKFTDLAEILKKKKLKEIILEASAYKNEEGQNLLIQWSEDASFWSEIEYAKFSGYSMKTIEKVLQIAPPVLSKLELIIFDISDVKFDKMEIESVKELSIHIIHDYNSMKYIQMLLLIFTKLKKLSIRTYCELKIFEIKNKELEEIEIECDRLEDEPSFVKQLINKKELLNVTIIQHKGGDIKWKKQEDQIYYESDIRKEIVIYSNGVKDLRKVLDELQSLEKRCSFYDKDNPQEYEKIFGIKFTEEKQNLQQLKREFDQKYENQLVMLQKFKTLFDFTYENQLKGLEKVPSQSNASDESN